MANGLIVWDRPDLFSLQLLGVGSLWTTGVRYRLQLYSSYGRPGSPFAPGLDCYAQIGARLTDLHVKYESQPEHPLERTEVGKLDWRVEKMALSKDRAKLGNRLPVVGKEVRPESMR